MKKVELTGFVWSGPTIAYKLLRLRKDGTLGPLFINARQKLEIGRWYVAESHPTPGYAYRPGWHVCSRKSAPHLSKKGRVWAKVEIRFYEVHHRPKCQGGIWFTAEYMKILEVYKPGRKKS